LHADDLGTLPRTLLVSAECDPLRDEGEALAERARAAGADVELVRAEGMLHGFASFAPFVPRAQTYLDDAAAWLREVLR
jgi:Esterase/lipase